MQAEKRHEKHLKVDNAQHRLPFRLHHFGRQRNTIICWLRAVSLEVVAKVLFEKLKQVFDCTWHRLNLLKVKIEPRMVLNRGQGKN